MARCGLLILIVVPTLFVFCVLPGAWAGELSLEERDRFEAEQRTLRVALECYRVDYNRYPQHFCQLTTPIAYCRPEQLREALTSWEYVAEATGLGYEVVNRRSDEFSFYSSAELTRKLQNLHNQPFSDFLRLAEKVDKPFLRGEILERGRGAFGTASRDEQSKAIGVLGRFARDPSSRVRAAAVRLLGHARRPELLPVFVDALEDESYRVRWAAIEGLGKTQAPSALQRLATLLGDPDPRTREQVVSALAQFQQPEALPALLQATRDSEPGVRRLALRYCAERPAESVSAVLRGALDDEEESVRAEAIRGLVGFPGEQTIAALLDRFEHEPSMDLKARIFDSLRALGAEPGMQQLSSEMSTEAKVELVKNDLRQMATAIEARFVDNSSYLVPDEVFVPGSIFAQRYGVDPEVIALWNQLPMEKRPTYGLRKQEKQFTESEQALWEQIKQKVGDDIHKYQNLERNRCLGFQILTTPIAYLSRIPRDPFNKNFTGLYQYGTPQVRDGWSPLWMLVSNGPDEDADIDAARVVLDEDQSLWHYYSYPFEGTRRRLEELIYDPTNGVVSGGDLVRLGPWSPLK